MLASIIGSTPFARQIRYQYTSIMLAPILIASIEGARWLWRFSRARVVLVLWLLACAYVTNVAWSPSPIGNAYGVWRRDDAHAAALRDAVAVIPDDAAVSSSFNIGPHLSRRRESYDWPNPFWPAYWGRGATDCGEFPSPSEIDYLALDLTYYQGDGALYPEEAAFIDSLIADDGEFDVIFEEDNVIVARRVEARPRRRRAAAELPGDQPARPGGVAVHCVPRPRRPLLAAPRLAPRRSHGTTCGSPISSSRRLAALARRRGSPPRRRRPRTRHCRSGRR